MSVLNYPTTFMLSSQVYRDTCNQYDQSYRNIVTINLMPVGPLARFVRRIQLPYLSPFQFGGSGGGLSSVSNSRRGAKQCVLALISLSGLGYGLGNFGGNHNNGLMDVSEVPDLFSFLLSNGYKIDTSLTKMMNSNGVGGVGGGGSNDAIAFITYIG
jgi:hypothetical protein